MTLIRRVLSDLGPLALGLLIGCDMSSSAPQASLAIVNARVWTGDSARPWADAIAVSGDTILAVGSSAEIRKIGAARLVDAKGGLVTPGFIDAHVHFIEGGFRLSSVQLRDARTPEEFAKRIREFGRDSSCRHLDHRRRLGPRTMGRPASRTLLDRLGHSRSSRVGEPARRTHGARQRRRTTCGRRH